LNSSRITLGTTIVWKAGIVMVGLVVWGAAGNPQPEARRDGKASERSSLLPLTFAKGQLQEFKVRLDAKPDDVHTLNEVEYAGRVFWVIDMHLGDGVARKHVGVYAPEKDGSYRQCLFAESWTAGHLQVKVDDKSGVLELWEDANSDLKGQVVVSVNLRTIGTQHSTGLRK
jgi:hypothetical protein